MYPGRPYGSPEPFPSLRLVTYRDGLEDYEMLEVYENLIKETCKKYNIQDIDPRSYAMDVYNSIFTNSIPTEDHHALYKAREEIANRILTFNQRDFYFTHVKEQGGNMVLNVYAEEPSLNIAGTNYDGESLGEGKYRYSHILGSEPGDIVISGQQGDMKYHHHGYANITNFASNNELNVALSDESSYEIKEGKLDVNLISVRKEDANKTIRFVPSIKFKGINLENAKKLIFKYSNGSSLEDLSFDVEIETNDFTDIVGGHFCIREGSKNVEIDLTKTSLNLAKVNTLTIKFVNYFVDDAGDLQIYQPRNIILEDIYAQY